MQYLPLLFDWCPSGPLIRCLGVSIWLRYSYELEGDIVWVPKKHTLRWRWVGRVIRGYVLGVTPREGSETGLGRWKKKFKKLWCPLNGNLWWSNRDLWRWAKPSELSQVRWEGWVFLPPPPSARHWMQMTPMLSDALSNTALCTWDNLARRPHSRGLPAGSWKNTSLIPEVFLFFV